MPAGPRTGTIANAEPAPAPSPATVRVPALLAGGATSFAVAAVGGATDQGDRPRAVRADRPRAQALAARLVGGAVHRRRRSTTRWCASSSSGSSTRLPALKTPDSVRRHLAEYLAEAGDAVPWWLEPGASAGARRLRHGRNGWPRRHGRRPA